MFKSRSKYRLYLSLSILLIVALISHRVWFDPSSILTNADWSHLPNGLVKTFSTTWGTWLGFYNLGSTNVQVSFYIFTSLWSLLGHIGIGYDNATKITLFIPIAIMGFISPFFLSLKLTKSYFISIAISFYYASTTYFLLRQTIHIPIVFVYSISPLVILSLIKAIELGTFKKWLSFILILTLSSIYELRMTYLLIYVLVLYFLMFNGRLKLGTFWRLSLSIIAFIGLSAFWALPIVKGGATTDINAIASRGLFGNSSISHALTLFDASWTGGEPDQNFNPQPILWYLWIAPIIAFLGLALRKKLNRDQKKYQIFFLLIAIVGIFLNKQASPPITGAYLWLYENFPTFSLYRESSKFFLLIAIGYAGLITYTLLALKELTVNRKINWGVIVGSIIIILSLINLSPFITGRAKTLFVSRKEPASYTVLNNFLMKSSGSYSTLWVPSDSRWGYYNNTQTKIGAISIAQKQWLNFSINEDGTLGSVDTIISNVLTKPYSPNLLGASQVKYVIVPLRDSANEDDFFKYYGDDRQYYVNLLNSLPYLKKINIGTKDLAVYQNTDYKPYFSTSTTLNKIDTFGDIDNYYDFQKDALGSSDLDFASSDDKGISSKTSAPVRSISDISTGLSAKDTKSEQLVISKPLNASNTNTLYANTAQVSYSYQISGGSIKFVADNANDLQVNGTDIGAALATNTLATAKLATGTTYSLAQGDNLYTINQYETGSRTIGATNDALSLYSATASSNLVLNGSFESGLWHSKIEDCNDYDGNAKIGMLSSPSVTYDGRFSLELTADKHTACTSSNPISVSAGQTFSLAYAYQIRGGQRAGYDLVFNDAKHTVLSADQIKTSGRWFNLNTKFTAPAGASSVMVRLKGYPDDQNKQHAKTFYDAVVVQPLTLVTPIAPAATPQYKKSTLTGSSLTASIVNSSFTYKNLIVNPSLENGLWQKKVGDCNAYDNNPLLSMELDGNDKTDGKQSLELDATRHVACTGPPSVAVHEGNSYLLSFDYQSPDASQAGYYVSFNDADGTVLSERIPITDHNWHTFTKSFVAPFGATSMSLSVYSYADEYGGIKEINRYDNFSLLQVPAIANRYYVVSTPTTTLQQPKHIAFQLDSPTKKQVQITSASTPFYLNMSESYHPQWRLELDDANSDSGTAAWLPNATPTAVSSDDHFNYDDFLNSWYVDPAKLCATHSPACSQNADGSYNLKLVAEFAPQRYFYVGLIVSGATLVACITYLTYAFIKPRRKTKPTLFRDPAITATHDVKVVQKPIKREKTYKVDES